MRLPENAIAELLKAVVDDPAFKGFVHFTVRDVEVLPGLFRRGKKLGDFTIEITRKP